MVAFHKILRHGPMSCKRSSPRTRNVVTRLIKHNKKKRNEKKWKTISLCESRYENVQYAIVIHQMVHFRYRISTVRYQMLHPPVSIAPQPVNKCSTVRYQMIDDQLPNGLQPYTGPLPGNWLTIFSDNYVLHCTFPFMLEHLHILFFHKIRFRECSSGDSVSV